MGEMPRERTQWSRGKVPGEHVEMGEYESRRIKETDMRSERMRTANGESDIQR